MSGMTSLQRCQTVLGGGVPDRVPVCLLNFMHAGALAGVSLSDYCSDGATMAAAHIAAWERFGHDMIDLENGVTALASAVGCTVGYEGDTTPPYVAAPALASIEDVDQLRPIDLSSGATVAAMLTATRLISRELGDRVCLLAEADQGPFSLAAQIVGIEEFLIALMDPSRTELVRRLLEYTTEQVITYGRALIDAGAHLTMMGESIAGPDVCAPGLYRRFALPYERRVIDTLHAEGKAIGLHICGNATRIIDDMVETGARFLQVDHKIDRMVAKRAARGRTTLIGTVDPSSVMALGTPDQVRAAALEDLRLLAGDGGFVLAPGCALPYGTPDANVSALVEIAHTKGRYEV